MRPFLPSRVTATTASLPIGPVPPAPLAEVDGAVGEALYAALWRSSGEAWLPSHGGLPFRPPMLGSHAVLVALHPEGMEVILAPGADDEVRLALATSTAVLAPPPATITRDLAARGGAPRLLVVVRTR